jgi:hypothetical protein
MKQFESTETLIKMLKNGQYKRLVMENEDEFTVSPESMNELAKTFEENIASPGNFDYLSKRKIVIP